MSENGPRTEAPLYLEVEVEPLGGDLGAEPSPPGGRVYDRTTVLIERDPIRLDEEGEEEGHCGADDDGVAFLTEGEEDEEGSLAFMADPDAMAQGYVHHTISPDQIQFTINPGSTPMPRNIEGATLTLHSECPETRQTEARRAFFADRSIDNPRDRSSILGRTSRLRAPGMAAPCDVLFKLEKGLGVGNPIVSGAQRVEGSAVCALTTRSFMKRETSGAGAGAEPEFFPL